MAHHYMFKEAHTISYIQQECHERIKGDEEETTYTQAIESLRVVFIDIQHGLEVYKGSKQSTNPWLRLCLVLRTWKAMAN